MKANKTLMAGALAAALFTIGAQAAETVQTKDVKVTATRVEKDLADVNMSVTVITAEDIKHSAARNVGELLQNVPGVRIMNDGSQGMKRVKVRGENAFRTLVMIDGQRSSEHKSMSGAPMLIDVSMIERIEVIKGPASVLYGSDAIGGAINIITKKGTDKAFTGNASAGYNTAADGVSASAMIAGGANGLKYRLGIAYEDDGDLDTPAGKMPNTDFNSKGANLFVSYDINEDAVIGATLDAYDLEFHSTSITTPGFMVDVDEWKRSKLGLFGEVRHVSDSLQRVRTDVFVQSNNKTMVNTIPGSSTIQYPASDNDMMQYGVSLQTDWQLGDNHYLIAGYEFNYDDLDAISTFDQVTTSTGAHSMHTKKGYDGHQMMNAIYATMESTLPNDFIANYGVRYTYVDTGLKYRKLEGRSEKPTDENDNDGKAVFNAGLIYNGIDNLTLRASYAQGYRHPILQELYVDSGMGGTQVIGNPDLKPETSDNFEIGARWNANGLNLDAVVFYNKADNFITDMPVFKTVHESGTGQAYERQGNLQKMNMAEAETFGLELAASYTAGNGFEPYATVTAMRREITDANGWSTTESGTPKFDARYGLRWSGEANGMNVRWDMYAVSTSEVESSRRVKDTKTINGDLNIGGTIFPNQPMEVWNGKYKVNTIRYAGYTTFNLTGGVDFGAQRQYSVDFGLYNVFDKQYQTNGAVWEAGRHAAVKFNAAF